MWGKIVKYAVIQLREKLLLQQRIVWEQTPSICTFFSFFFFFVDGFFPGHCCACSSFLETETSCLDRQFVDEQILPAKKMKTCPIFSIIINFCWKQARHKVDDKLNLSEVKNKLYIFPKVGDEGFERIALILRTIRSCWSLGMLVWTHFIVQINLDLRCLICTWRKL